MIRRAWTAARSYAHTNRWLRSELDWTLQTNDELREQLDAVTASRDRLSRELEYEQVCYASLQMVAAGAVDRRPGWRSRLKRELGVR
jgi:hypothetical protein